MIHCVQHVPHLAIKKTDGVVHSTTEEIPRLYHNYMFHTTHSCSISWASQRVCWKRLHFSENLNCCKPYEDHGLVALQ